MAGAHRGPGVPGKEEEVMWTLSQGSVVPQLSSGNHDSAPVECSVREAEVSRAPL